MKLIDYFKATSQRPTPWCAQHGIPPSVISKFLTRKGGLSFKMAVRISEATGKKVALEDLIGD
jgi:hypothetical protein